MNPISPPDAPADAGARLADAYHEWRQWTEAEGTAIRAGHWLRVGACQDAKRHLQPRIQALREAAERAWARLGETGAAQARAARATLGELISLETQNRDWLAARHQAYLDRSAELDRSRANLRRLRGSYVLARGAAWSFLS